MPRPRDLLVPLVIITPRGGISRPRRFSGNSFTDPSPCPTISFLPSFHPATRDRVNSASSFRIAILTYAFQSSSIYSHPFLLSILHFISIFFLLIFPERRNGGASTFEAKRKLFNKFLFFSIDFSFFLKNFTFIGMSIIVRNENVKKKLIVAFTCGNWFDGFSAVDRCIIKSMKVLAARTREEEKLEEFQFFSSDGRINSISLLRFLS